MTTPTLPVEAGDPAVDARAFRRCLGQFTTGVTVVTTVVDGAPVGVTANSFSSLSLDPPLVLWSIARSSRRFDAFARARHFAVNILGAEQVALSQLFAGSVEDRFADLDWRPGLGGAPLLPGILAHLECETESVQDGGDHAILVGRVSRFARHEGTPLIYAQGRYAVAEDHPSQLLLPGPPSPGAADPVADLRLTGLLSYVSLSASEAFDAHRQAEGVTRLQSRALFALGDGCTTADAVVRRSYLSPSSAEDTLAGLTERGLAEARGDGLGLTAAGRDLLSKLVAQLDRFEADLLAGILPADLAASRRVLEVLHRRLGTAAEAKAAGAAGGRG